MSRSKRFGLVFTLFALGLAIGARPAPGQTMSFFRQFSAPGTSGAIAVAADTSGLYVFWNTAVSKYDSRGNELWTREFSAPANGIGGAAADATGAYVLAFVGPPNQVVLRKYSADGSELWTRQLEFRPNHHLAADATGVYVAGGDDFPGTFSHLRKYSPDGAELWTSRFENPRSVPNPNPGNPFQRSVDPTPYGLAVDATGVYMMNQVAGVVVRKWDASGNELWTRQLYPFDFPRKLAAADPSGFYVLAGVEAAAWGNFLRKYDSGGNELWSRKIEPYSELGSILAADATGVYVSGKMPVAYAPYTPFTVLPGQCRSGSGGDSFVRKYDPDGAELWSRQFGTSDAAWASGMAVDSSGVYVVGEEGAAQVRDDFEHFDAFEPANPTRGAFLAKFEKTAAVVTRAGPRIFPDCVVNAASHVGGGVAPGEIVTLFGSAIGPSELVQQRLTENGSLATDLADTRILFNGVPAPLMYVSDKQSQAIVPYAVAGRSSVDVQVEYKEVRSDLMTVPVLASRPGIFTLDGSGQGQGAILNEDGSPNSPSNPARRGSIVTLSATGGGEASPGVEDGQILSNVLPQTSLPVWVFFDLGNNEFQVRSKPGEVLYAGGVSGSVPGMLQVKVRVPANAVATGNAVPFLLIIGSHWTVYQATIALR